MSVKSKRTNAKDELLLDALADGNSITCACKVAGYARRSVFRWRTKDEKFGAAVDSAIECGYELKLEAAEDALETRAITGWDEPVYQGGELVGVKRKFSDSLLALHLKALAPKKYRDRVALTDSTEAPVLNIILKKPDGTEESLEN